MDIVSYMLAVPLVGLQALLCVLLLRGPFKKYLILLFYSLVQLVTSAVEFTLFATGSRPNTLLYRRIYWSDEILLDLLLFLLVIVLTYRATEGSPIRPAVGKLLTGVVVIALALPFLVVRGPLFSMHWFNVTSQLLNFGAAIMNLGLWTALIGSKKRDPRLLVVSAGLGVMVTGAAIAWGLRQFVSEGAIAQVITDKFGLVTQILAVAIWCWAFRPAAKEVPPAHVPATTHNV